MLTGTQLVCLAAAAVVASVPALGRPSNVRARDALAAGSVAVAFVVAHVGLVGWPRWSDWVQQPAWIALAAGVVAAAFAGCKPGCGGARLIAAAILASLIAYVVIVPARTAEWGTTATGWASTAALAVAAAFVLERTTRLAAPSPGAGVPSMVGLVAGGAAFLALFSHYATFALLAAALGLALVPLCARVVLGRDASAQQGAALAGMTIALSLLVGGYLHSLEDDRVSGIWFALAGAAPLLGWLPPLRPDAPAPRSRAVLRVALVALAVVGAIAGGAVESTRENGGKDDVSEWESEWE